MVRTVCDRGPWKIEGWRERLDDLGRLGATGLLDLGCREHIHRHRRLGGRPLCRPSPDDGDLLERERLAGELEVPANRLFRADADGIASDPVPDVCHPELVGAGPELEAVGAVLPGTGGGYGAGYKHARPGDRLPAGGIGDLSGHGPILGLGRKCVGDHCSEAAGDDESDGLEEVRTSESDDACGHMRASDR